MTQTANKPKKKVAFLKDTLKLFIFFYIMFSILRFFIYKEPLLSLDPLVILMSFVIAVFFLSMTEINSLLKIDHGKKIFRYFLIPLGYIIIGYFFLAFLRYPIMQDTLFPKRLEIITLCIMFPVTNFIETKIDEVSPRNPNEEAPKSWRYYYDKFIKNATPFHKVMFFVYGFCILLFIFIIFFSIVR